jgi:hypothetical protein
MDEALSIINSEFGRGNVGVLQTYFNTFKCFVGIGILATPYAFKNVFYFANFNYYRLVY